MERARTRLRPRPADPPRLSPAPEVIPKRARSASKRRRREPSSEQPSRRIKRTRGRSIPCRNATDNQIATAATSFETSAQSVPADEPPQLEHQGQPRGQPDDLHIAPTNHEQLPVINNILSGNTETLVLNRDTLSELISMEIEKKMSVLTGNNQSQLSQNSSATQVGSQNTMGVGQTDGGGSNAGQGQTGTHALEQAVSTLLNAPGERDISLINTMRFDLPLDSSISEKVKKQIVTREYIDLGCLLSPEADSDMNFNVSVGDEGPSIVLNSARKVKPILNINGWTNAMHIYGSIYLRAHPDEIAPFFQYMEFVIKMSRKGGFYWKQYDEAFRRARQHDTLSWGMVLVNQYMACFTASVSGNSGREGTRSSENSFRKNASKGDIFIPKSYCFTLHRQGSCKKPNCQWDHSCFSCKGNHSILQCKKSNSTAQNR